ncbi:2-dehydropantoate 2-reductase [Thermosinus carboxydivorans Nor1]|uniref:2-dehydropantoate 2-reductase n=1 Tax=Thermosinus carboxydivorans Nor1 TaxID=401526 RepID=A1HPU2_9FIRM|nr:2-dehydropantoate 2-reductase [Thermosinus carboxydivorans]EAX48061.1 2-dehydropantoate 2-reductase [Thermosinus carboxydivorans Nor1]
MKIAIIGAGAMGSLFGGRLAQAGEDVWLLDVWEEHVAAIQAHGLTLVDTTAETSIRLNATTQADDIGPVDLVIIFVKSYATPDAAQTAAALLGPATTVLTLQNGLGNAETLAKVLGAERVVVGTTAMGATLLGPGRIKCGGQGPTHIGSFSGGANPRLHDIATIFARAGIHTVVDSNVTALVWSKLIINVGINAITALTGIPNGQVMASAETRELVRLAVAEAVAVARASGIPLPHTNYFDQVATVAQATRDNRSSMLQDVTNRRRTEIDAINGAIVAAGKRLGVPTPVNETLTLLIKTLEQTYLS